MKLNLGAGTLRHPEWISVDLHHADELVDLGKFPWPWGDASADELLASHVLEHFTRQTGFAFLTECYRILAPGGTLHLAVPDMDKFIDCRESGDWTPLGGYRLTDANWYYGGDLEHEPNPAQRHHYVYCYASLAWTLKAIGFHHVRRREAREWDNPAYHAISLYVSAVK